MASAKPALAGAFAVLMTMAIVVLLHDLGPHAWHMSFHILAMNVVAPALAVLLARHMRVARTRWLWIAALGQISLLWAAHLPAVQNSTMQGPQQVALHSALLLSALMFWLTVLSLPPTKRWQALPALLLTGKLVCLLAALLVFAPRALYGAGHHGATINDQQLAALLMITACPLSYLVAAIIIAARLVQPSPQQATS